MAKLSSEFDKTLSHPFTSSEAFASSVIQHHLKVLLQPLTRWKTQKKIPPVILLAGLSGIGKKEMTSFLAKWILCERKGWNSTSESPQDLMPCGKCGACLKIAAGTEINFSSITSDSDEEGKNSKSLKIEQFRKLKSSLGFGAYPSFQKDGQRNGQKASQGGGEGSSEGSGQPSDQAESYQEFRIVAIPNCDRMTPQAANSILKLLEEPPAGWVFLLTCTDPALLLPTLASRCQIFRLHPFTKKEIEGLFEFTAIDRERAPLCAELSQGSWERAFSFAEEDIWNARRAIFDFINEPLNDFQILMDWASEKPRHFDILLDILEQALADLIRWSINPNVLPPPEEFKSHTQQLIKNLGCLENARLFWISQSERIAKMRAELLAPLNRKLLLQDLLLPWVVYLKQGAA